MFSTIDNMLICLTTSIIVAFDNFLPVAADSNAVRLNVYFEPQDPESTKLIKQELLPLFQNAELSERVSLKLVPFGYAKCDPAHQEYVCTCSNGDEECSLMHLMACTLHDYRHHEDAIELISCIQGQPTFEDANHKCIRKLPAKEAAWLNRCRDGFRGKYLSWINGLRTKAMNATLTSVPTVTLNSRHTLEPIGLRQQICNHLEDPKPKHC